MQRPTRSDAQLTLGGGYLKASLRVGYPRSFREKKSESTPMPTELTRYADHPIEALHEASNNPRTISVVWLAQLQRTLVADPAMLEACPIIALPEGVVIRWQCCYARGELVSPS